MINETNKTAVEGLYLKLLTSSSEEMVGNINVWFEQAKAMQKQQAQNYAEFCVMCDREKLPLLDFESFILTYGGNK